MFFLFLWKKHYKYLWKKKTENRELSIFITSVEDCCIVAFLNSNATPCTFLPWLRAHLWKLLPPRFLLVVFQILRSESCWSLQLCFAPLSLGSLRREWNVFIPLANWLNPQSSFYNDSFGISGVPRGGSWQRGHLHKCVPNNQAALSW